MDRPNFIEGLLAVLSAENRELTRHESDTKKVLEYVLYLETESSGSQLKHQVSSLRYQLKRAKDKVATVTQQRDEMGDTLDIISAEKDEALDRVTELETKLEAKKGKKK